MSSEDTNGKPDWLADPWYTSAFGWSIVLFDAVLTLGLVVLTVEELDVIVDNGLRVTETGGIPWFIYVFTLLGALGYVFTTLVDDFHRSTSKIIQYNFRLLAALPLGAGVFILADVIVPEAVDAPAFIGGVVFLAGLYVNLAYKRLGALAERLLPKSE